MRIDVRVPAVNDVAGWERDLGLVPHCGHSVSNLDPHWTVLPVGVEDVFFHEREVAAQAHRPSRNADQFVVRRVQTTDGCDISGDEGSGSVDFESADEVFSGRIAAGPGFSGHGDRTVLTLGL